VLKEDDVIYTFTDGFIDQFGGADYIKFGKARFKELLLSIHALPLYEQKIKIEQTFVNWKGNTRQIDDVLVVGIKI
jgi:serine phosphatase RsbU (regulator of sigma subunit)